MANYCEISSTFIEEMGKSGTYSTGKVRPWIISVNGNIGSGKSTLMDKLSFVTETRDESQKKIFDLIPEPIEAWKPWLKLFYENPQRYAYSFQSVVLLHQMIQYEFINDSRRMLSPVVLFERDPLVSKHIFAETLVEDGSIHPMEMEIYNEMYRRKFHWIPDYTVYIRTPPEICAERVAQRARSSESSIPLDYLRRLHYKHEELFVERADRYEGRVIIIDGSPEPDVVAQNLWAELQGIFPRFPAWDGLQWGNESASHPVVRTVPGIKNDD